MNSNLQFRGALVIWLLAFFATSAWSQPFAPGTYNGWSWEGDDEIVRNANSVTESRCVTELQVVIDGANNWTYDFDSLDCGGRITGAFGHSEFVESDLDSDIVPGSLPLANAGGLLYELFVDSDDNPGTDARAGTLLFSPNRSLVMRASSEFDDDGNQAVLYNSLDLFARRGATPVVADIVGDYQFANQGFELEDPDQLGATQFFATVRFDGLGGCALSNAGVTGVTGDLQVKEVLYTTLSGSGDAMNQSVEFTTFSAGSLPCSYRIDGNGRLELSVSSDGEIVFFFFFVSDDRRYLVPARHSDPAEESDEYRLVIRSGNNQNSRTNASLDGIYLFNLTGQSMSAGGTGRPGGGPGGHTSTYTRGAVTFDSAIARLGPDGEAGWAGCGVQLQTRSAMHRFSGNPAAGGLNNEMSYRQFDIAAERCTYKVNADGGVLLHLDNIQDDAADVKSNMHGYVSDNGEALLLQAQRGAAIDEPGFEDLYEFVLISDLLAIRYQGDLRGDADQDNTTNFGEFLPFGQEPLINEFPMPSLSKNAVVLRDATGNGVQEVSLLRPAGNGQIFVETRDSAGAGLLSIVSFLGASFDPVQVIRIPDFADTNADEIGVLAVNKNNAGFLVQIRDGSSGVRIANVAFLGPGFTPICVAVVPDVNGNGRSEIAVLAIRKSDNAFIVQVRGSGDGELIGNNYYLGPGFEPKGLVILPDSDGDGVVEAGVLAVNRTNGSFLVQVRNISGPSAPRNIFYLGSTFTPLAVAYAPDVDGNGIVEVVILAEKNSNGRLAVQTRNAFGAPTPHTSFFLGLGFEPLGLVILKDADDNGTPEAAVYAERTADSRFLAEVRNLNGPRMPNQVFFMDNTWSPLELISVDDRDGNDAPDLGAVGERNSDGRIKMQMRNAAGVKNPLDVWFAP